MYKWKNDELNAFYGHEFDFDNQYKNSYDDWIKVFRGVIRNYAKEDCFMGLSSGYDSGVISCEMYIRNIPFKAYVLLNGENEEIINERLKYISNNSILTMNQKLWQQYYDYLKGKINPIALTDSGSMGLAYLFDTAKKEGKSVFISGQGADEIFSDYALSDVPGQSTFKGTFPDKLYEWPNFRKNVNYMYLQEIEEIANIYSVKVHYPYLNIVLVQEFLWLAPELKNRYYKAPLREYLTLNRVPFEENAKYGFHPTESRNEIVNNLRPIFSKDRESLQKSEKQSTVYRL